MYFFFLFINRARNNGISDIAADIIVERRRVVNIIERVCMCAHTVYVRYFFFLSIFFFYTFDSYAVYVNIKYRVAR